MVRTLQVTQALGRVACWLFCGVVILCEIDIFAGPPVLRGALLVTLLWTILAAWLILRGTGRRFVLTNAFVADALLAGWWLAILGFQPSISVMMAVGTMCFGVAIGGPRILPFLLLASGAGMALGANEVAPLWREGKRMGTTLSFAGIAIYSFLMALSTYVEAITLKRQRGEKARLAATLDRANYELSRYLPRQLYEAVFHGSMRAAVASERRYVTVFFSDIVGFTPMVESLEPSRLTHILNGYLSEMVQIAMRHGGTVDKFIGDAVMVVFGAPESEGPEVDAKAGVAMALEMQHRLMELRDAWAKAGLPELHVRMGIHSGVCTVGSFGSEEHRLDYTAIGQPVNIAARLQASARPDEVVISDDTKKLVKWGWTTEPRGALTLKGVSEPVVAHSVLREAKEASCEADDADR